MVRILIETRAASRPFSPKFKRRANEALAVCGAIVFVATVAAGYKTYQEEAAKIAQIRAQEGQALLTIMNCVIFNKGGPETWTNALSGHPCKELFYEHRQMALKVWARRPMVQNQVGRIETFKAWKAGRL